LLPNQPKSATLNRRSAEKDFRCPKTSPNRIVEKQNQKTHIIDCFRKSLMLNTLNTFLSRGMNHCKRQFLAKKSNFSVLFFYYSPSLAFARHSSKHFYFFSAWSCFLFNGVMISKVYSSLFTSHPLSHLTYIAESTRFIEMKIEKHPICLHHTLR